MQKLYKALSFVILISLLLPVTVLGGSTGKSAINIETYDDIPIGPPPGFDPSRLKKADVQPLTRGEAVGNGSELKTYLVVLEDEAVPRYMGGISGLPATNPGVRGDDRLDINSPQVKTYTGYLRVKQDNVLQAIQARLGRGVEIRHQYLYALNGFALKLTANEATRIAVLPGILRVEIDRAYRPTTDVSPEWLGAVSVWDGSATGEIGTKGEGVIVGVIDTGINMDHPSFAAVGDDGYTHVNPLGSGNYLGACDHGDVDFYYPTAQCNDKLIGAYDYADASWDEEADGPYDHHSHGSHTASTAAGNYIEEAVLYGPTTSYTDSISGMAPHANIIAYDVCGEFCYNTDVIAAVNKAIENGVDVINESIGVGSDPFSGEKQIAYLNAVSAGIFYARSAGNDGPDSATVGPEPPWTLSTAALTHNRKITNELVNMSGGIAPPADISGEGFTAGYGPAEIVYSGDYTLTLKADATVEDARLCAMGEADEIVYETPWEEGTFDGEIVVCDRGVYPRVEKGKNVLDIGAGGFVLADNGGGVVSDAHYLPGLHINQADGDLLKAWLDPTVVQTATITGFSLEYSSSNGDVMAGFSSRGPGEVSMIKPDAGAPGVAIWAAYTDNPGEPDEGREFGFMGGTSMASPHVAGLAALVKAAHPTWTPSEIKSALMTTATTANTVKEDGSTPADPFDVGSGRVQVDQAVQAGLLFDISIAEYTAANESNVSGLNLPSFADDACNQTCSWTRTVSNPLATTETWDAVLDSPPGVTLSVEPGNFTLAPGSSQVFILTATISNAPLDTWAFGSLTWAHETGIVPEAYLPLAVYFSSGLDLSVLKKEVDLPEIERFETLNYTITVENPNLAAVTYTLTDTVPVNSEYISETAWGGLSYNAGIDALTWHGGMDASTLEIQSLMSPQYTSLKNLYEPFDLPTDQDEGGWIMTGFDFWYLGEHFTDTIWSINGTLEAGTDNGISTGGMNLPIPNSSEPNFLIAPWWSDINILEGGEWYIGTLTDGVDEWDVLEWNNVARKGSGGSDTATFQIWIQRGTDTIWFEYKSISGSWTTATVGVEDESGSEGVQYYFNGTGSKPSNTRDLYVVYTKPTPVQLGFAVQATGPSDSLVVNEVQMTDQDHDGLVSMAITTIYGWYEIYFPIIMK